MSITTFDISLRLTSPGTSIAPEKRWLGPFGAKGLFSRAKMLVSGRVVDLLHACYHHKLLLMVQKSCTTWDV